MSNTKDLNALVHRIRAEHYGWSCSCGEWGVLRTTARDHLISYSVTTCGTVPS